MSYTEGAMTDRKKTRDTGVPSAHRPLPPSKEGIYRSAWLRMSVTHDAGSPEADALEAKLERLWAEAQAQDSNVDDHR